ncbi:alpha/beta fold hydrolase [Arenimonas terrae]|jgi:pimeloyl-ACP methyl ester carboxylesterase|uniref:Alpha/beta fold hydrolase n=1 Tax=Arenimonas terrae TaxID=2546226 RepID=A0A5C4RQ82_9GAMM|nr:alpha/beta fold hydrolase [Arenimonas terrae]TNJ33208.1 alpha/beta fold hydrolase [Arenimonas terrae]
MHLPLSALRCFAALALLLASLSPAAADAAQPTAPASVPAPVRNGYVPVNGVRYYYELHGRGEPLLLLHGGLGTLDMFGPVLPMLARSRTVIAVDLHGHGRTALGDRPIDFTAMANDLATLVAELGHPQVDVMGYSMGGSVALRLAIQHPARVRRLVVASAGFARDGFYPEMLPLQAQVSAAMAKDMVDTPMFQVYRERAPRPQDFPKLLDQMGAWMRQPYDWSDEVRTLRMPVMLVYGDSDMLRLEHIVQFYQLLGGGLRDAGWGREHMSGNRLAIIPNLTHYEAFSSPALAETVIPFLDAQAAPATWAEQVSPAR